MRYCERPEPADARQSPCAWRRRRQIPWCRCRCRAAPATGNGGCWALRRPRSRAERRPAPAAAPQRRARGHLRFRAVLGWAFRSWQTNAMQAAADNRQVPHWCVPNGLNLGCTGRSSRLPNRPKSIESLRKLATPAGFEPATPSLEGWCSIRLSYGVSQHSGLPAAPGHGKAGVGDYVAPLPHRHRNLCRHHLHGPARRAVAGRSGRRSGRAPKVSANRSIFCR